MRLRFFTCSAQNLFSVCIFHRMRGEKSVFGKRAKAFLGYLMWKKFNFLFWEICLAVLVTIEWLGCACV